MAASTFISSDRHIPRLAFAPQPAELPIKPGQENKRIMRMDAFVSESCPSLYRPYNPPWWMRKYVGWFFSERLHGKPRFSHSGHIQTAYCVMGDFTKVDKAAYHRQVRHHIRFTESSNAHLQETVANG